MVIWIKIGLIPDGNRRHAENKGIPEIEGHRKGAETLENFLKYCLKRDDVDYIVVYALSQDNLEKRSVKKLLDLECEYFKKLLNEPLIEEKNVLVCFSGNLLEINKKYRELYEVINKFEFPDEVEKRIIFLLNYHWKDPINRNIDDLDMLIRSGDRKRISGFCPEALAYAELVFEEKMWPECNEKDFEGWFKEFEERQRNFGE